MVSKKILKWLNVQYFLNNCIDLYSLDLLPFNLISFIRNDPELKKEVSAIIVEQVKKSPKFWDYRHNNIKKEGESQEDVDYKIFKDFIENHPEHKKLKLDNPLVPKFSNVKLD